MYSYQLYFRDFCELIKQSASSWLDNLVVRALHRYHRAHGLESRSVLTYFSGFLHATPPQVAYIIGMIFHCLKMFHQTSFTTWMSLDRKEKSEADLNTGFGFFYLSQILSGIQIFFVCPTLVTCWLFHLHICFTELKIYSLSFFHHTVRSRHCWS